MFHDVYAYSYGGWGMYTDEGSTGILFENNLVYRVKTGGFHQHYGKENVLRNNVMAFSKLYQLQATRVEDHLSFNTLENNIVYYDTGVLLSGPWDRVKHISRNNCYWNAAGEPVTFLKQSLAQWQAKGHEQGSIVADPKLVAPHAGRLPPGRGLAGREARVQAVRLPPGRRVWRSRLDPQGRPGRLPRRWKSCPSRPPSPIVEDFERQQPGQAPGGIELHVENRGDSIAVARDPSASGRQCLKVVDAPGLKHVYNPHFAFSQLNYPTAPVRNAFDLRIERPTQLRVEWRDYSEGGYQTGPTFLIHNGRLELGPGAVMDLPAGQWIHFEIDDKPAAAGYRWTLRVTLPGQAPRVFADRPLERPGFKRLTWVGFMSVANEKTTYWLDNFELRPQEALGGVHACICCHITRSI